MERSTDVLWRVLERWLASEESFWRASSVLLRLDLKYRTGKWDGAYWPRGL